MMPRPWPGLRRAGFALAAVLFGFLSVAPAAAPEGFTRGREVGGIVEYTYEPNGLTVLLFEEHSAPVVTFQVTYRVGSRHEKVGTTGATHLLEHLMFKGSPKFNHEKGTDASRILDRLGALSNATTWTDRTNYFANLPSEHLETLIDIEADRMRNAWLREEDRRLEMTVVRNEYERNENSPFASLSKELWGAAFIAHPYSTPTIGWRSDIERVPIEKLREFRDTYYWPNNATVSVVGDFEPEKALALIAKYFGAIPKSPHPIPSVYTEEPLQRGPRRVVLKRAGQVGVVAIGYKAPRGLDADAQALDVLQTILTEGKNSRLYRALIDANLSLDNAVQFPPWHDPSLFAVYAFVPPGVEHAKVEEQILAELEKIKQDGVTADETARAISQLEASTAFNRDGPLAVARDLNEWIATGDWTYFATIVERWRAVTPADILRVAQKYLIEDASTTGWFVPVMSQEAAANEPASRRRLDAVRVLTAESRHADFGPHHYRNPNMDTTELGGAGGPLFAAAAAAPAKTGAAPASRSYAADVRRNQVAGIDAVSLRTGLKNVVTINGSLAAGDVLNPTDNTAVAGLVASMLDKGTTKHGKFELAEQLERVGATINFSSGTHRLSFAVRCLKKDAPLVLGLLAEQLREPAFDPEELTKLKLQEIGGLRRAMESVEYRSDERLRQLLFPPSHPNFQPPIERQIADIEKTTVDDLRAFHRRVFGPAGMIVVAVGDVDGAAYEAELARAFSGWQGGVKTPANPAASPLNAGKVELVTMSDKPSFTVRWGIATGLKRTDADYLPLALATHALGGNFTSRLMLEVRERQGLTYDVRAMTSGDQLTDGYWQAAASFAPELLAQGLAATEAEIKKWVEQGISADELAERKDTLTGLFKVALSTSEGMAGQLLAFLERGYGPEYLDQHPEKIRALTLEQVNGAIRKYVKPAQLVVVKAGTPQKAEAGASAAEATSAAPAGVHP